MLHRLQRSGNIDLEFDGKLIADESTAGYGPDPTRWTEIRIYQLTNNNGWVTATVGKSSRPGEVDRARVLVCKTPEEVKDSLRRRRGEYLINAALDALHEAALVDVRLAPAARERI